MMKKCLAVLLSTLICVSALALAPITVSAQDVDLVDEGAEVEAADVAADVEVVEEAADVEAVEEAADAEIAESGALDTPIISGFTSVDEGTKITWKVVTGSVKTRVFYKSSKGWSMLGDSTGNSFIDTGVSSGTKRTYTLRCVNAAGTQYTSGYDTNGKTYTYNMATPQINWLKSTSGSIEVGWKDVPNCKRYYVYVKNSKNGWTRIGTTTTDIDFFYRDAEFGKDYTFTVRCANAAGNKFTSSFNSTGWTIRHYLDTPAIGGFEDTANGVRIKIKTTFGSYADRYAVYAKKDGKWKRLGTTTGDTFDDNTAVLGNTYTYTVRAMNADGTQFASGYNSTGWSHLHYLKTPSITGFTNRADGVRINLSNVAGAERYAVYVKKNGWTRIGTTTGSYFDDKNAVMGNTYTYTVRCLNNAGNKFTSSFNNTGWSHKRGYLATPQIVGHSCVAKGIFFRWNVVPGADKYRVFYKAYAKDSWHKLLDTKSTECTDERAEYGKSYIYTVRCLSSDGKDYVSDYDKTGYSVSFKSIPAVYQAFSNDTNRVEFTILNISHAEVVDYYKVWYKNGNNWILVGQTKNGVINYPANMIYSNRNYTFTVMGYDDSGQPVTGASAEGVEIYVSKMAMG